jgi:hypothetical protein
MTKHTMRGITGLVVLLVFVCGSLALAADPVEEGGASDELKPEDKLVILWVSGDFEVAEKMLFMYAGNAPRFGWWEDITLVVWGPSAKLLAENKELQTAVQGMAESGIKLEACKACADMYEVSGHLVECGIDVKYMGDALTKYIKEGRHVLTI